MLEHYIRNRFQKAFVTPVIKPLSNFTPVSPMTLTLLGGLTGITTLPLLYTGHVWMAVLILLLSGYLDIIDGSLARLSNKTSAFGCVMDITCDRLVEFAVILGLFLVDPVNRGFLSLIMLGSVLFCVTSFLVVGIFSDKETEKSFHYSPGLMGSLQDV